MSEQPEETPPDVDTTRPNAARIYDYYLGGGCNFGPDREFAKKIIEMVPEVREAAQLNRAFLRRAVRFCVQQGIRQFLDIGSGVPTVGNVHEVAQQLAPDAKVVYVDNEPVAVAHAELLLRGNSGAGALYGDLTRPSEILRAPIVTELLDLSQPIAVMMVSMLHFVPDEAGVNAAIAAFRDAVVPGSYLVISHATPDPDPARLGEAADFYQNADTPFVVRSPERIAEFLAGTQLAEPGLVFTPQWRPDTPDEVGEHPERSLFYAAVGRKP